jgi:hypothetical protein
VQSSKGRQQYFVSVNEKKTPNLAGDILIKWVHPTVMEFFDMALPVQYPCLRTSAAAFKMSKWSSGCFTTLMFMNTMIA